MKAAIKSLAISLLIGAMPAGAMAWDKYGLAGGLRAFLLSAIAGFFLYSAANKM